MGDQLEVCHQVYLMIKNEINHSWTCSTHHYETITLFHSNFTHAHESWNPTFSSAPRYQHCQSSDCDVAMAVYCFSVVLRFDIMDNF